MKRKNPYLHMGIAAFFTICAALLFYDTLFGSRVLHIWQQFLFAVEPILYGAFIAYLLAPVVNFFERTLFSPIAAKNRSGISTLIRAGSLALTWLIVALVEIGRAHV